MITNPTKPVNQFFHLPKRCFLNKELFPLPGCLSNQNTLKKEVTLCPKNSFPVRTGLAISGNEYILIRPVNNEELSALTHHQEKRNRLTFFG
jgi:hypothetical protein